MPLSLIPLLKQVSVIAVASLSLAVSSCQTSTSNQNQFSKSSLTFTSTTPSHYAVSSSAGLETLVKAAVNHNPAVTAAQHKVVRLEAKVPQMRSLPDPKAKIAGGSLAETAAGQAMAMVGVEQSIPYPGKRKARASAAQKDADAARAELANVRLRVAERVRFGYWDYYNASQMLRIQRENKQILNTIQEVILSKIEVGKATQSDFLRLSTQLAKTEQEMIISTQNINITKATLNALLNRPPQSLLPAPRRNTIASQGSLSKLLANAELRHPSVRANQARISAFRQKLKAAELDRFPDFAIGAQYTPVSSSGLSPVSNGKDQAMLTLGFTIPLWQEPRKAKIREATAGIAEMQAQLNLSRSDLQLRIQDAHFRLQSTRSIIELYRTRLIPDAEQALKLNQDSYAASTTTFIDLLDSWRTLLALQLQQQNNYAQLGRASASLKSAANLDSTSR